MYEHNNAMRTGTKKKSCVGLRPATYIHRLVHTASYPPTGHVHEYKHYNKSSESVSRSACMQYVALAVSLDPLCHYTSLLFVTVSPSVCVYTPLLRVTVSLLRVTVRHSSVSLFSLPLWSSPLSSCVSLSPRTSHLGVFL